MNCICEHPPRSKDLTTREQVVLRYLADGLEYKQISERLKLRTSTVRTHIHNIYKKLGVTTYRQAVRVGLERGWVRSEAKDVKLEANERSTLLGKIKRLERELHDLYRDLDNMGREILRLRAIEKEYKAKLRPVLSDSQRAYLWAFDHYVREWAAGNEVGEKRMRNSMTLAAGGFMSPEIIQLSRSRPNIDPLDKLAQTITFFDEHATVA